MRPTVQAAACRTLRGAPLNHVLGNTRAHPGVCENERVLHGHDLAALHWQQSIGSNPSAAVWLHMVWLQLAGSYGVLPNRTRCACAQAEIDELVDEWKPEALAGALTRYQREFKEVQVPMCLCTPWTSCMC